MVWDTGIQSQIQSYRRLKKMVLDISLFNSAIIRYRQRERSSASLPTHHSVVAIEKGDSELPLTTVGQLIFTLLLISYRV